MTSMSKNRYIKNQTISSMNTMVVRISKYISIFATGQSPKFSKEVFAIKKVKNIVLWRNVIENLNAKEIVGTFHKKELQQTSQKSLELKIDNYDYDNSHIFGQIKKYMVI